MIQTEGFTKTVLIVDDEPQIRSILRMILENEGFDVLEAENGVKALISLKGAMVDLVITDLSMPGISGKDILRQIRTMYSIPVLVITGDTSLESAVEAMKLGAQDYITKPIIVPKVVDTVEKALVKTIESDQRPRSIRQIRMRQQKNQFKGYKILEPLGEGTMGIVYLVEKEDTKKHYALKLYKDDLLSRSGVRKLKAWFHNEAEITLKVNHPNIVKYKEIGLDENAMANYLVMEFVQGIPLDLYASHNPRLNYHEKALILYQVADALLAIHQLKICHRDLKPANILVCNNNKVKLTDFGIATPSDSILIQTDSLAGSPMYMSPEAFSSPTVDYKSDIFSLGIVAYQFLLGCHPFKTANMLRLCYLIRNEAPKSPQKIDPIFPEQLTLILDTMLKKNPADRYLTLQDACSDLMDFINSNE